MANRRQPALAAVFDLDDTLYPERDYVRSGYHAVARAVRNRPAGPPPAEWLWNRFLRGESGGAFDAMNAELDLGLSPRDIARLVEVYRTHRPNIRPCHGMPALLGRLHERCRLGLLTDGFLPAQRLKLEALGIGRFLDAAVFTEELGRDCWKPSPAGFEAIRERLGVPHEACAYVADNPAKDFVAPNELGWRTVRYVFPGQVHAGGAAAPGGAPQFVARALDEIRDALLQ